MGRRMLVENGDVTLRVEVTGRTGRWSSSSMVGPSWPRHGITKSTTSRSVGIASRRWTSGATEGAPHQPRSSGTPFANWPVMWRRWRPPSTTARSCWPATTGVRRSCGTPPSATPVECAPWPGSAFRTRRPLPLSLLDLFDQLYPDRFFYMLYFQEPGVAEAAFAAEIRDALKRAYFALSGDAPAGSWLPDAPRGAAFLPLLPEPPAGPLSFLSRRRPRRRSSDVRRVRA